MRQESSKKEHPIVSDKFSQKIEPMSPDNPYGGLSTTEKEPTLGAGLPWLALSDYYRQLQEFNSKR